MILQPRARRVPENFLSNVTLRKIDITQQANIHFSQTYYYKLPTYMYTCSKLGL